jgi:hypothetical protein
MATYSLLMALMIHSYLVAYSQDKQRHNALNIGQAILMNMALNWSDAMVYHGIFRGDTRASPG